MDNNNMLKLCRLCLVKDDVNIPIFEEQGDIRQIFLKISSCLPVKVSRDDQLPKKICDGCSYKLDMLYEFWNTSANAEKQLLTWLGEAGMSSQMADGTISAVAQQIKPADAFVKQETIDPPDIHMDDDDDDDEEDKDYMKQEDNSNNVEEPPPKRARRTAAVKAAIALDQNSDDDDDSGEPMTKVEDDSEDSDNEDHEPAFVDVPSTSADDQPGPSGVGKDGVEAPKQKIKKLKLKRTINKNKSEIRQNCYRLAKNPRKETNEPPLLDEPIKCEHCRETFKTNLAFAFHSVNHRKDGTFFCHLCNTTLKTKYTIETHIRTHDGCLRYKCQTCGEYFNGKSELRDHENCHISGSPYQCEICGKHFQFQKHLSSHIRGLHNKSKSFECKECNITYKFPSGLYRHIHLKHKSVDPSVICDICGKILSCREKLKSHQKAHSGNIFRCSICSKSFVRDVQLKIHMRTHTGEKPYECKFCGKAFKQHSPYRYHIKNHIGLRPHVCRYCSKSFIAKNSWKNHVKGCELKMLKRSNDNVNLKIDLYTSVIDL
ncbi:zinc finger protein 37-like isoform X27 [Diorhabda carinulata]|uniref:zinc finger protein 37-like isoform X27 n=1 Tax=Diorhabda carinulata TaxID=1163345 RepID=UPI0025A1BE90|nr:zinc finger protein 37-like isoform X27 [Diorhabda carinulata]